MIGPGSCTTGTGWIARSQSPGRSPGRSCRRPRYGTAVTVPGRRLTSAGCCSTCAPCAEGSGRSSRSSGTSTWPPSRRCAPTWTRSAATRVALDLSGVDLFDPLGFGVVIGAVDAGAAPGRDVRGGVPAGSAHGSCSPSPVSTGSSRSWTLDDLAPADPAVGASRIGTGRSGGYGGVVSPCSGPARCGRSGGGAPRRGRRRSAACAARPTSGPAGSRRRRRRRRGPGSPGRRPAAPCSAPRP